MALGGITAGLNVTVPSGTSQAGTGQADIRSIKTTFQEALDSEHHFPNTGGAGTGAHRQGSGRAFYAAGSALSSTDTDGRLFINSTASRLHHAGSSNTMLLGGQYVALAGPAFRSQETNGSQSLTTSAISQFHAIEYGRSAMTRNAMNVFLHNTYVRGIAVVSQTDDSGSYSTWHIVPVTNGFLSNTSYFSVQARETNGSQSTPAAATYFNYIVAGHVGL